MMKVVRNIKLMVLALSMSAIGCMSANAQSLQALPKADRYLPFNTQAKGIQHEGIKWGLDTAWDSEVNVRRGISYMGKENVEVVRVSFQPTYALVGDTALTQAQLDAVKSRIAHAKLAGTPELEVNDDHASVDEYFTKNGQADIAHWANLIMITTRLYQKAGLKVTTISPFNEPDYGWGQGTQANFRDICKYLKENYADELEGIRLSGGNTLNNDQAAGWYDYLKPYIDEGNTHQLAGSFDNYAAFYTKITNDGLYASADEMHNVGDALVGLEYGMKTGIWWGYDGRARGQMCRAIHGDRLAYAENRDAWTAAAVYRNNQDDVIECFVGGSERQANNCSYTYVCTDKDVYFDGVGPTREYYLYYPGGTGYQNGQSDGERVIDISYGPDVQPDTINGTYQLMCRSGKKVLSTTATATSGSQIYVKNSTANKYDDWKLEPVSHRVGGDWGYYIIRNAMNDYPIDDWNWGLDAGAELKVFNGSGGTNEQWYLKYAGEGYYYLINRYSNLYLTAVASTNGSLVHQTALASTEARRRLQQWKIIPTDAKCETVVPAAPTDLKSTSQSASINLTWTAPADTDVVGYMILRADKELGDWNTIARKVKGTSYLDNNCEQGKEYYYRVKAIDYSDNISDCSDSILAKTNGNKAMIAQYCFEDNLNDTTQNAMNASYGGTENYSKLAALSHDGTHSFMFSGSNYLQLPYQIANMDEMTICTWVKWTGTTSGSWQRLFDFGNSTDQYMFFTPNNGSKMRFVMKNGGDEQILEGSSKLSTGWRHLSVTIGKDSVKIFVDGKQAASTADITIRPSDIKPVLNYVARSQYSSDPYFKGYIDDFRVYNYELSQSDIQNIIDGFVDEDVNKDSTVDSQDILKVYEYMKTSTSDPSSDTREDVNKDSTVDSQDVLKIYEYMKLH